MNIDTLIKRIEIFLRLPHANKLANDAHERLKVLNDRLKRPLDVDAASGNAEGQLTQEAMQCLAVYKSTMALWIRLEEEPVELAVKQALRDVNESLFLYAACVLEKDQYKVVFDQIFAEVGVELTETLERDLYASIKAGIDKFLKSHDGQEDAEEATTFLSSFRAVLSGPVFANATTKESLENLAEKCLGAYQYLLGIEMRLAQESDNPKLMLHLKELKENLSFYAYVVLGEEKFDKKANQMLQTVAEESAFLEDAVNKINLYKLKYLLSTEQSLHCVWKADMLQTENPKVKKAIEKYISKITTSLTSTPSEFKAFVDFAFRGFSVDGKASLYEERVLSAWRALIAKSKYQGDEELKTQIENWFKAEGGQGLCTIFGRLFKYHAFDSHEDDEKFRISPGIDTLLCDWQVENGELYFFQNYAVGKLVIEDAENVDIHKNKGDDPMMIVRIKTKFTFDNGLVKPEIENINVMSYTKLLANPNAKQNIERARVSLAKGSLFHHKTPRGPRSATPGGPDAVTPGADSAAPKKT